MKSIEFSGITGACSIFLGAIFNNIQDICATEKILLVIDENVLRLHREKFSSYRFVEVKSGEDHKTLAAVEGLYGRFLEHELDRSTTIIGVGGGITCDITGFAATTYLRGLPFAFVPTTLLALVDASVGGKNGVNFHGYKNLVGTFSQPRFVLGDFSFLATLPFNELKNGFAEVIKHALIGNRGLFDRMEDCWEGVSSLDRNTIEEVVSTTLNAKIDVVSRDETEKGERRKLNFGHTLGHAIEKVAGLSHGEAISIGMVFAARMSQRRGLLNPGEVDRIEGLLRRFQLPTQLNMEREAIIEAIGKDKKREDDSIHFVFLDGIGKATVENIKLAELREVLS